MDRDPIEMLRAANPVTHDTPIDADAMIARVMLASAPRRSRSHALASFKARMAAAVTLAAAATVGAIVTISSLAAPSLAPLSLAAAGSSPTSAAATPSMMICQLCNIAPYTFVASGLSNDSSSAPVYMLSSPDPTSTATALATYLGLTGATTAPADGVTEITSGTTTLDVSSTDLGSLYITDTNGLALPDSPSITTPALEAAVQNLLAVAAPGYQLVDPQVTVTTPDPTNSVTGDEFVSYSVSVEGNLITNLSVSADFDTQGSLLSLTAPLFSVTSDSSYPLITPAGGVDTLNAEAVAFRNEDSGVNPGGPMEPASTTPTVPVTSTGAAGSSGSASGSTAASPPPTIPTATGTPSSTLPDDTTTTLPSVVTLTSDSLDWYLSALSNGQVAAIPVYSYSGTYADGTSGGLNWRVPALDPSAVSIPSNWTPFQFWAWGHAVPMMFQGVAPAGAPMLVPSPSPPTTAKP
jgi:hypothetical protein